MQIVRRGDAPCYEAPGHHGMACLRLQGMEASHTDALWVGLSLIEPGGLAEARAASVEKIYVAIGGEITIVAGDEQAVLGELDSCRIAPGESRILVNRSDHPATVMLIMPYPVNETSSDTRSRKD